MSDNYTHTKGRKKKSVMTAFGFGIRIRPTYSAVPLVN